MAARLLSAAQFRRLMRSKFKDFTHERIAEELGLSAGFVGMVLSGHRAPSRKILKAMKMEAVTFYRASSGKGE